MPYVNRQCNFKRKIASVHVKGVINKLWESYKNCCGSFGIDTNYPEQWFIRLDLTDLTCKFLNLSISEEAGKIHLSPNQISSIKGIYSFAIDKKLTSPVSFTYSKRRLIQQCRLDSKLEVLKVLFSNIGNRYIRTFY
jgi:hypothetical protein